MDRARERTMNGPSSSLPAFTALPVKAIDQAAKNDALEKRGKSARRKPTPLVKALLRWRGEITLVGIEACHYQNGCTGRSSKAASKRYASRAVA
jgi:hypothetical protein